jgi:hypothetical protein
MLLPRGGIGMSTTDNDPEVTPGAVAAIAMALLVLVGVVVLFLLLKFNLFQGGSSNDVRTSSPVQAPAGQLHASHHRLADGHG